MIDVITVTTADFVDYANLDYRIKRTSTLYKILELETWVRSKTKTLSLFQFPK